MAPDGTTGNGGYIIGVSVFGHTTSILEDVMAVAVLGVMLTLYLSVCQPL